ncbi:hypothetical protein BJ170DRAFT_639437 [Xylariales sp. AK1849]|nr:hypothetical protein BJ170DRAFT_639437 [Xylariales sp. AK1849]
MPEQEPPSYEQATGSATFSRRERNGIPLEARRSMEDESRPLPDGWVRTYDPKYKHQFYVDRRTDPPRAIWHHPYDDDDFINSLAPDERSRIQGLARHPSREDIATESTDEEGGHHDHGKPHHSAHASSQSQGSRRLGRKMKDKLTGTTHEQRAAERQRREQQERDMYRQHQVFRRGLEAAIDTGQPQCLGKDDNGVSVYLEPPGSRYPGVQRLIRISPYIQEVEYKSNGPGPPGARHIRADGIYGGYSSYGRPYNTYNRPYGNGYGGGTGMMPLAAPLLGGMLLGGILF